MYFFDRNEEYRDRLCLITDDGKEYTYKEIWERGEQMISGVPSGNLVLLLCGNDIDSVSGYLALLRKKCPVILMGKNSGEDIIRAMTDTYQPAFVIKDGEVAAHETPQPEIFPDLGLLLSTSGSTGARKLVRLSYDNLQSNCDSIVEYLGLNARERPITTLPMEYTYGLSVIHSHLAVGASIILTDKTLFQPEFWELAEGREATSIAGVPYTYEMLDRLRITRMKLPALKTLTQAGGHLPVELQEKLGNWAAETGRRFFVMYGQTEATARMSYIPPERCLEKIGSIGIPVPGGKIELIDTDGSLITEPGINGELIYRGPNVSLGYAVCREDLGKGDENNGRLETGDIAYRDEEGYFYISGRKKRFIKLLGKRISLDQLQDHLQEVFDTPEIVCTGDDKKGVHVWVASEAGEIPVTEEKLGEIFWEKWGIRGNMLTLSVIPEIPRNEAGKIRYAELKNDEA